MNGLWWISWNIYDGLVAWMKLTIFDRIDLLLDRIMLNRQIEASGLE